MHAPPPRRRYKRKRAPPVGRERSVQTPAQTSTAHASSPHRPSVPTPMTVSSLPAEQTYSPPQTRDADKTQSTSPHPPQTPSEQAVSSASAPPYVTDN